MARTTIDLDPAILRELRRRSRDPLARQSAYNLLAHRTVST